MRIHSCSDTDTRLLLRPWLSSTGCAVTIARVESARRRRLTTLRLLVNGTQPGCVLQGMMTFGSCPDDRFAAKTVYYRLWVLQTPTEGLACTGQQSARPRGWVACSGGWRRAVAPTAAG